MHARSGYPASGRLDLRDRGRIGPVENELNTEIHAPSIQASSHLSQEVGRLAPDAAFPMEIGDKRQ